MAEFNPEEYAKGGASPEAPFDPAEYAKGAPAITREEEIRRDNLRKLLQVREPGYTERIGNAVTSGVMAPLVGVTDAAVGKAKEWLGYDKPATFGERYRGAVQAEHDYANRAKENTPGALGVAADLVGGAVGAGKATKAIGLPMQMLHSGVQGAVTGASENADDPTKALIGGTVGGAINAGTTGVLGGLIDRLATRGNKRDLGIASRQGGSQTLEREGSDLFNRLDNAGIHFSERETPALANRANAAIANSAYSANVPDNINAVLRDINTRSSAGAMTYGDVRKIQTQLSDLKAHSDPGTRRLAGDLSDAVDEFIHTAKPTMPASSIGTVSPDDLTNAKDLWRRGSQASTIEGVAEKGMRRAADPAEKLAGNFERYSDKFIANPDKYNPNNPAQMRIMDELVQGSPKTKMAADAMDKWSNYMLGAGATSALGGQALPYFFPDSERASSGATGLGTAGLVLGGAMKGGSAMLRQKLAENASGKVDDLLRNIVTGQTAPQAGDYVPKALMDRLLAKQNIGRMAGGAASSQYKEVQ
jgi:hypothetical protein